MNTLYSIVIYIYLLYSHLTAQALIGNCAPSENGAQLTSFARALIRKIEINVKLTHAQHW
jgi:hypothetical protein